MNYPTERFALTKADRMSPVWRTLHKYLSERLQILREMNDSERTLEGTARLRGQIAELKAIIALNDDALEVVT